MIANSTLIEKLEHAFMPGEAAIVGMVDLLLDACPAEGLRLTWTDSQCCVRLLSDSAPLLNPDLPKSAFRTLIARVAALCNSQKPDSVSPYGGQGVLVSQDRLHRFRVTFVNTPSEQWLELSPCPVSPQSQTGRT